MSKATRGCLSMVVIVAAFVVMAISGKIAGILLLVAGLYVIGVVAKASPNLSGYAGLAANGVPARGILLEVNPIAASSQGGQVKIRAILVDVEVPGQPPFEVRTSAAMPANLSADVIPGATMELRLHPKDRTQIAIVGPGVGFVGAPVLGAAPGAGGGGGGGGSP